MKFNEQMAVTAARGGQQRSSDGDDVRWTEFYGTPGQQTSRNLRRSSRKSAKLEHRRQSSAYEKRTEVSEDSTTPSPFQCSRVPTLSSVSVDGGSVSDASSWRTLRWHRYQWVVYIVAVVLVGAISEVHCDAASSSVSSEGSSSSSSSSRLQVNREDQRGTTSGNQVDGDDGHFLEDHYEGGGHYTHHWAVHIPEGGPETVEQVAQEHGFINHGKILDGYYHFEHRHVQRRSVNPAAPHQQRLDEDDRIHWSQQQRAKRRTKRDFRPLKNPYLIQLNDPKWPEMWYLNRGNGLDMNVIPAWKEGVTGKGVVVTILDDGLESDHPDLEHNYDPGASYDVNGNDGDPMPHYDLTDSNRHGTRCAGEVAATANNSKCAVGIAYGARVGGVRMLDGDVTDVVEAKSLGLHAQHIDIYSASWGPDDDGKTVDGPGDMATRAFIEGVRKGRGGKGSIFIWASGNGGREHDNCNCDGYTNSIWTLSISSASQEGLVPWFSEMCSSTLATTYSSGNTNEKQVITTDLHHSCTSSHTGTSASAPLAAGIAALVLEANRNLTWRDLQHIVVRTAKPGNLKDPTWAKNGVGRRVSHSFGYGLMDAAAMVRLARTWKTVPDQQICEINAPHLDKQIPPRTKVTLQLLVEHCMGVNYLEHVQAKITLTSQRRGDIQIFLTSPSGTRVTLLTPRSHDLSRSGFNQWPFMSVHTWGEAPHGVWLLEIHNEGRLLAQITQWNLIFYGTEAPAQPDDPTRIGKPGGGFSDSNFGGEIEHNSLEFESGVSSDQWRNMQQIGESHVDVQRTASSDVTSLACLRYDRARCLVCGSSSFFYNGRCYSSCPASTFPDTSTMEEEQHPDQNHPQRPLPPNSVRRRDSGDNAPGGRQPHQERDSQPQQQQQQQQSFCIPCHATCLECSGPAANQCTECQPEHAFDSGPGLRQCVSINGKNRPQPTPPPQPSPKSDKSSSAASDKRWLPADYLIMITVVGVTLVVAFAGIYLLWRRCFRGVLLSSDHHQYDRVETSDQAAGSSGVPSYAELVRDEIDGILAESSTEDEEDDDDDDGRESRTFMAGRIIAPIER